jgi:hypothetical protein
MLFFEYTGPHLGPGYERVQALNGELIKRFQNGREIVLVGQSLATALHQALGGLSELPECTKTPAIMQ